MTSWRAENASGLWRFAGVAFSVAVLLGFGPIRSSYAMDPVLVGNTASLIDNILAGEYLPPPETRDPQIRGFIEQTLNPQPYNRFRTPESILSYFRIER